MGTDDEAAAGGDQGDSCAVRAGEPIEKGTILDELCATTGWRRTHHLRPQRLPQRLARMVARPA
jgi:hypothetical protein